MPDNPHATGSRAATRIGAPNEGATVTQYEPDLTADEQRRVWPRYPEQWDAKDDEDPMFMRVAHAIDPRWWPVPWDLSDDDRILIRTVLRVLDAVKESDA